MTSIYLVEDEVYAMMALKQKIMDLQGEYVIVGAADNGAAALEQILDLCPDIVLTDIRMPDMDGLTLISKLQEKGCQSLPVIVSGYQDFEYAKQAVKLGAADYLLKPVNPPELYACLKKCCEKLSKRSKNIVSFLIGEESFSFETAFRKDSFIFLYIITANPLSSVENMLHPNVRYLPNGDLERLFCKFYKYQFCKCFDGFFSNEKMILICGDKKGNALLAGNLPYFVKALEDETGKYITVYYMGAEGMSVSTAIRECRVNAVRCAQFGKSTIHNEPVLLPAVSARLGETADLYAMMLGQNQTDLLESHITRLLKQWEKESHTCRAVTEDLLFIMDTLKRSLSSKRILEFNNQYYLENVISFSGDYDELARNFYLLLRVLFAADEPLASSPKELVESLIVYFKEHLSCNVTLQDLEERTGVSKVYICRIFKKFQNTTPMDFFTRLKIARAKELLADFPGMSLREIADSLGFNDVYYFSKVFKRITGAPPSEMRPDEKS